MSKISKLLIMCILMITVLIVVSGNVFAKRVKTIKNAMEAKEFRIDELYISQENIPSDQILNKLTNNYIWNSFIAAHSYSSVYFDPRSGRPTSLTAVFPLIPGTGDGNHITLESLSRSLGWKVESVGEKEVRTIALQFLNDHANLLNINIKELGNIRAVHVTDFLWQIFIPRQVNGIPVRDANIVMTINNGNLVVWGIEKWGDVNINLIPSITKDQAVYTGMAYIGGPSASDKFTKEAHLEIVPVSSPRGGLMGQGYDHRLVWAFNFKREGYSNNWEMLVDAHKNQIIEMRDLNVYAVKKIVGATYPNTNDDCCPEGCPEYTAPMSYTNTGLAAPNNYTDLSGTFNWTSGTVTTTLAGRYVTNTESCAGSFSETSTTGDIDLGGTYNQHDCTAATGHSTRDTFSIRTCAAEVAQANRIARSWVNYAWLDSTAVTCTVDLNATCNAYQSGNTVNFYRSGGGCRNTGEETASILHEWAHAVDVHDTNGAYSSPEEVYADMNSILKLHKDCPDRGWWWTYNAGCGKWTCPGNSASTGYMCDGYGDCCTTCTGLRELDYAKHVSGVPHTPANFNCVRCSASGTRGPCNRETHCENAPSTEAGWDLGARDLQAAPFNYDRQTAFELAYKTYMSGSGSITNWYACNCSNNTSSGCGANTGYMQWLAADDDNGNVNNGTPHMTAIYAALNRHAVACATPTPTNSGCSTGPTQAPTLTATPGDNSVSLSWTAVTNAASYNVMKAMGTWACDQEKVKIANVTTTTYVDQAFNGYPVSYAVQGVGGTGATNCLGLLSTCVTVTPNASTCTAPTFGGVSSVADVNACTATGIRINWNVPTSWGTGATGGTYDIRRYTTAGCTGGYTTVATGLAGTNTTYVDTSGTAGTTYYYQINAINNCTTPLSSTGTTPCSSAIVDAVDTTPCPNVGNTLKVTKSGINASVAWTTVTCTDIAGYRIYGSTTYSTTFPTGWTLIATPTAPPQTDPLASTYVAYKGVSLDACGNASSN